MKPWVQEEGYFSNEELILFERIKRIFQALPDIYLGKDSQGEKIPISCHMIARAFARHFGLEYQDGHYCMVCEHSWLVSPEGNVIDLVPCGAIGGPVIVAKEYLDLATESGKGIMIYKHYESRFMSIDFDDLLFRHGVRRIVKALQSQTA